MPPTSDEAYARLHAAGWSIGDASFIRGAHPICLVYGHRGGHRIKAEGRTQREAWEEAVRMAERVDELG